MERQHLAGIGLQMISTASAAASSDQEFIAMDRGVRSTPSTACGPAAEPSQAGVMLKVGHLPSIEMSSSNLVYVSQADAEHIVEHDFIWPERLAVNGIVFNWDTSRKVDKGTLAMGRLQRNFLRVEPGQDVEVSTHTPQASVFLGRVVFGVRFIPNAGLKDKKALRMNVDDFVDRVREKFQGQVLAESQVLALPAVQGEDFMSGYFELTVLSGEPEPPVDGVDGVFRQGLFGERTKVLPQITDTQGLWQLEEEPPAQPEQPERLGPPSKLLLQEPPAQPERLWVWIRGSASKQVAGEYLRLGMLNGMPFWAQVHGRSRLLAHTDGYWRLEADASADLGVWRSAEHHGKMPHEVEWGSAPPDDSWDISSAFWSAVKVTDKAPKGDIRDAPAPSPFFPAQDSASKCEETVGHGSYRMHGGFARGSEAGKQRHRRNEVWENYEADGQQHFNTHAEGAAFVQLMRSEGKRNWVYHGGQVINLEDPKDTMGLPEETLVRLLQEATEDGAGACRQALPPPVPLQPWEVQKLESVATQVTNALRSGRYSKDFGDILINALGGWAGDVAWAQAEQRRLAALVEEDDQGSRSELLRWIEDSLMQSLREVTKELNRGQLAGAASASSAAGGHGSGSGGSGAAGSAAGSGSGSGKTGEEATAAAASSGGASSSAGGKPSAGAGISTAGDELEELALKAALQASLEEATPHAGPGGAGEDEEWAGGSESEQEAGGEELDYEEEDIPSEAASQCSWEDLGAAADGDGDEGPSPVVAAGGDTGGTNGCGQAEGHATAGSPAQAQPPAPAPASCGHACGLAGSCCACIQRSPRPGALPGLVAWWQRHGTVLPPLGASGRQLRFYCATCVAMAGADEGRSWPLPFGGALLLKEGDAVQELVGPAPAEGASVESPESAFQEGASWVAVSAEDFDEAASEASWLIAH